MTIRSDRWPHLSALLDQALELAPEARAAWLAGLDLPPADAQSLQRLLAAVDGGPTWMDRAGPERPAAELKEGDRVGPFRIDGVLGRGGMGVVHAAERETDGVRQPVALKLLPASLDSAPRRARFLEERRLLARLEHPGIARLIDAGVTEAGQPWFAMERIQGEPIDRYCDRLGLGVRARLRLLLAVCEAVQYAHGQLVVHRDIKPSNILVDQDGRVRLLDFGIAKAMDDGEQTGTVWRALTPSYAAPEQIRGEPVSAASDVWSLGVLLYLLLVGRTPFADIREQGGPAAELGAVLDREALPPSRLASATGRSALLARELRGDIDAIVLRALARDPARRYGSVDALAADLRRPLAWQPVQARRGVWSYRTGRVLRRYRLPVAITLVAVLALAGTVLYALSEARRAQLEAERASLVKEFLIGLFELGDPDRSGEGRVDAGTLLRLGADRALGEFSGDPVLRIDLTRSIAQLAGKLGDYDQGVRALDAVLAQDRDLDERNRAELLLDRADLHAHAARPQAALADLDAVRAMTAPGAAGSDVRARELRLHARLQQAAGEFDAARAGIDQALVLDRQRGGDNAEAVARDLLALAELEHVAGNRVEAQRLWSELLAVERRRLGERHSRIADIEHSLGVVAAEAGDNEAAEAHFQRAAGLREALLGAGHPLLAQTLRNWGGSRRLAGDADTAETLYRRALAIYLDVLGPEHPETGFAHNSLGVLHSGRGDLTGASEQFLLARHAFASSQPDSPVLATIDLNLAAIAARLGEWEAARQGFDSALRRLLDLYGEHHAQVAATLSGQARLAVADARPVDALALLQRVEAIYEVIYPGEHLDRLVLALGKARVLMLLDRQAEATVLLDELVPRLDASLPPGHPLRLDMAAVQAAWLFREGRIQAAFERLAPVLEARRTATATAPVAFAETALAMARLEAALGRTAQARALLDELDAAFPPERLSRASASARADLRQRLH